MSNYTIWIRSAIEHARFWMAKAGLDAQQRRAFWLALAARELTQPAPLGKARREREAE